MTDRPPARAVAEIARFLEWQNLGLNLTFALAFLLLAAHGLPSGWTTLWIVVAFVAARNAGHAFNRWADRAQDAENPRTQDRALVRGRLSPSTALAIAAGSALVLILSAGLLNRLALLLAPVALLLIFGYSYTKRFSALTTPFLGLVEAITPAAIFIAVEGALPLDVLWAVAAMLAWGTAFEVVHSLGDLEADRRGGLRSVPLSLGEERARRLVPLLHGAALALFALFGAMEGVRWAYYLGLAAIAGLLAVSDLAFLRGRSGVRRTFQLHYVYGAVFLAGVAAALFLP